MRHSLLLLSTGFAITVVGALAIVGVVSIIRSGAQAPAELAPLAPAAPAAVSPPTATVVPSLPTPPPTAAPTRPAPAATSTSAPARSATVVPTSGPVLAANTGRAGNWEIQFQKLDAAKRLGGGVLAEKSAQGIFVVVTMNAKNLHRETSTLNTWDFQLSSPQGLTYKSSNDGITALMGDEGPEVLWVAAQVQPGLSKTFRLVFDVDPSQPNYTLQAAGINFQFRLP